MESRSLFHIFLNSAEIPIFEKTSYPIFEKTFSKIGGLDWDQGDADWDCCGAAYYWDRGDADWDWAFPRRPSGQNYFTARSNSLKNFSERRITPCNEFIGGRLNFNKKNIERNLKLLR